MLAAADRKADPVDGDGVAVADDQIRDLDMPGVGRRDAHAASRCSPRVARKRMASATATVRVWMSARAAVSSLLELFQALAIEGAITLALGPMRKIEAPSSLTLAMNMRSHAARIPGRSSGRVTVRS